MKKNKSKIVIIVLAILLALVTTALVITAVKFFNFSQTTSTSSNNKIAKNNRTLSLSIPNFSIKPTYTFASNDEKITLTEKDKEEATSFAIENMLPGDSISKTYIIKSNDESATSITFSCDFVDNTKNPTEAQQNRDKSLMNMVITANGKEIYNGAFDSISNLETAIEGKENVTYVVTIALSTSAGNEYANLDLSASFHWTLAYLPLYKVTYIDNANKTAFENQEYEVFEGKTTPAFVGTPKRSGYRFVKWSPDVAETVTSDVTYKAIWEELYTVTYTDGSANEDYFQTQTYKDLLKDSDTPAFEGTPTRTGYTFEGWSPTIAEKVTANVTYTAQWKLIPTYSVKYTDGVEDKVIFADIVFDNLYEGDDTPAFEGTPTREGYTFKGWSPTVAEKVGNENVTYTAQWEKIPTYIVTYTDGTGNQSAFANQVYSNLLENADTPAFEGTPTREGYTFEGWNPTIAEKVTASVTYEAQWEEISTYIITYTDGTGNQSAFANQAYSNLLENADTPAFVGTPTREGYTFKGWSPVVAEKVTASVTYIAQWEKIPTYIITYTDGVANEVIFEDKVTNNLKAGENTPSFGENPTREGYTFKGWYPTVAEKVSASVTYTAQWEKIPTYIITYVDGVDDQIIFETIVFENVLEGATTPACPITPTREYYTFIGWNPEVSATVTANVTYTAQWRAHNCDAHTIDDDNPKVTSEIEIKNPLGGDEWVYHYQVKVDENGYVNLYCAFEDEFDKTDLYNALEVTILYNKTNEVLYEGLIKDMPDSVKTSLSGEGGETCDFTVTVSLDNKYGELYKEDSENLQFSWWLEGKEEKCYCPICLLISLCGGPTCVCPTCAIGYAVLALLVALVIFLVLKKKHKNKPKKEKAEKVKIPKEEKPKKEKAPKQEKVKKEKASKEEKPKKEKPPKKEKIKKEKPEKVKPPKKEKVVVPKAETPKEMPKEAPKQETKSTLVKTAIEEKLAKSKKEIVPKKKKKHIGFTNNKTASSCSARAKRRQNRKGR